MADSAFPFTHEMVVVHKLFRREFTQGPGWVRRVAAATPSRRSWSPPT